MEVTSASRGNNRLFHSASSAFSAGSDSQISNFELLLDLPTASACCPVEVDENPPPEPAQTDSTEDAVPASEQNAQTDASQSNSDEDDDRLAESVASELAVIQAPLPKQVENDTEKVQDESSSRLEIASDTPVVSATKADTPAVDATTPAVKSAQQAQVKQVKLEDDEAASQESAQTKVELALPKPEVEVIDAQQGGLNRDANKKAIKEDAKNNATEEPTLQTETPIRLTEKNESSENVAQEPIDQLKKNEQVQAVAVDKDRSNDSGDRPARWYEQDSSQQSGETNAKEIASGNADPKDASTVSTSSDLTASANESLTLSGMAEVSQADALGSDIPSGVIQADTTLAASTSSSTLATGLGVVGSEVAALDAINSESATSGVRPGFSTEQKLANKTTGIPGNNLESSQTGQQVDISRAEKVRLAQRVARSFSRVGPTGGSVQLKLHPPELGSLAVNIKIEGKSMSAKLTTESQAAREVIMESLPQLRTRLAEQGYDVVQFTVDVASESATTDNQSGTGQGTGQSGAGQGGQSGSSETGSRSLPGTDLRRSNYLRRQIDAASQVARPTVASFSSRSVDVQA